MRSSAPRMRRSTLDAAHGTGTGISATDGRAPSGYSPTRPLVRAAHGHPVVAAYAHVTRLERPTELATPDELDTLATRYALPLVTVSALPWATDPARGSAA